MEKNANYAMVGASTLILFIGLVIFIVWLARLQLNRNYDLYDILFQGPVRGLSQGSEVHFNGIKVGEVTRITLDRTNPSRVVARARVTSDVPIRADSYAILEPQGITGVNYVQITAGAPTRPLLKDTVPPDQVPVIRSQPSMLSDLLEGGGAALTRADEALDRVNRLLSDQNIEDLSAAISDVHAATSELRERKAIIADADKTLKDIDGAAQQLSKLGGDADQIVNGDGKRAIHDAADAVAQTKEAATKANAMLGKLEGPTADFASTGLPQINATMLELQNAAQSLDRLLNELQTNPRSALGKSAGEDVKVKP